MNTNRYPHLFSSCSLGPLTLKNRIAVAPMTRVSATEDGRATPDMQRYYERFAEGNFGLIITEGTYPDLRHSQGYIGQPGIANREQADAWRPVVDAVHRAGSAILLQLMHAGAQAQGNHWVQGTIAPSAVRPQGEQLKIYRGEGPYPEPRAMTVEEIVQVRNDFVAAAQRAQAAGFDGVEIHGANGYLLDQFLTDYFNQRDDDYGGTLANRVRLLAEICEETRKACGKGFAVGIRISQGKVSDYAHKWAGGERDAQLIFETLAATGIDYLHTTEYAADAPAFGPGTRGLAELAKMHGRVAIIANGNLDEPDKAEQLVASGMADVVALGKKALANRDWPQRAAQQESLEDFDFALLQPLANIKPSEL